MPSKALLGGGATGLREHDNTELLIFTFYRKVVAMYLHIGSDVVVSSEDIVGVFDLDNISVSKRSVAYLNAAEKKGQVLMVGVDIPKSAVICVNAGVQTVYLTQIASATILKRFFS